MNSPKTCVEIVLQPGDFWFGDRTTRIRTLLGSCVSIVLWHPRAQIGGMCHFMMPCRPVHPAGQTLDGRYADEALSLFLHEIDRSGTFPGDYVVKIFGGGRQFERTPASAIDIPERNVQAGLTLLAQHGFVVNARHLGGSGHREVILDVWSGAVWVRHVDPSQARETA